MYVCVYVPHTTQGLPRADRHQFPSGCGSTGVCACGWVRACMYACMCPSPYPLSALTHTHTYTGAMTQALLFPRQRPPGPALGPDHCHQDSTHTNTVTHMYTRSHTQGLTCPSHPHTRGGAAWRSAQTATCTVWVLLEQQEEIENQSIFLGMFYLIKGVVLCGAAGSSVQTVSHMQFASAHGVCCLRCAVCGGGDGVCAWVAV